MKYFISLLIFTFSINCYGETNREILEDIRDQQMFMQFERDLQNAYGNRNYDSQNRPSQNVPTPQSQPYRNPLSEVERVKQAKFWDLNMSEYLRRDEIGHISCDRYRGTGVNTFSNCSNFSEINCLYLIFIY